MERCIEDVTPDVKIDLEAMIALDVALEETVFLTSSFWSMVLWTRMSWTRGGRTFVGLESTEVLVGLCTGAGGWLVGRLEEVVMTLDLSCEKESVVPKINKNAATADRYQIFFD